MGRISCVWGTHLADIFISHSSQDNAVAAFIAERIKRERPTWSLFYDADNIRAGQRWQERLREELQSCRIMLAVVSSHWLRSPWCFTEAVTASFRGKEVIGIEIEDLTEADLQRAPPILSERQRVRLRYDDDRPWQDILETLDRSGLDPDEWFPIPSGVGPYPGLVAFDEKDAGTFFGRKQEITDYLGALDTLRGQDRSQILTISGASGSGKSSLLRAGLIPRLRRKPSWVVISPFELAREPVRNLLDQLRKTLVDSGVSLHGLDFTKIPDTPVALATVLDEVLRRLEQSAGTWVLLSLDQAEALLTTDRSAGGQGKLIDALALVLGSRARHVVVAATIRSEFVARFEEALRFPDVRIQQVPLRTIVSIAEVIEKPAERFGLVLEPGLSAQIIDDVERSDALPLLAYTLKALNEVGGDDHYLASEEYQALGGVRGAIGTKLGEVLTDPHPTIEEAQAIRRVFTRNLVRVDDGAAEGERYLRKVVRREALPAAASRVIERLVNSGLLISRESTIELAHERLIDDWPHLPMKTWLLEDAANQRLIHQLRQRESDETLPDGLFVQAQELFEKDPALQQDEPKLCDLLGRSVEYRRLQVEQRNAQERRRRWVLIGAIAAAIAIAGIAGAAVWQWTRARLLLSASTRVANSVTVDLARKFRDVRGVPVNVVRSILLSAEELQNTLVVAVGDDVEVRRAQEITFVEIAKTLLAQGDTETASGYVHRAQEIAVRFGDAQPNDRLWQVARGTTFLVDGDIKKAQGSLAGALESYRKSLAIREKLVALDPNNADWQGNLSSIYTALGDVQTAQGSLKDALDSYQRGLAIDERLSAADPGNTGRLSALSVDYRSIGDIKKAQGSLAGALESYRKSLAILEKLVALDPNNADWQNKLSFIY
ncbi:toll/interleukin-1 receptor domain-containing protein, partial [Rhizobium ruizarguesonis]